MRIASIEVVLSVFLQQIDFRDVPFVFEKSRLLGMSVSDVVYSFWVLWSERKLASLNRGALQKTP